VFVSYRQQELDPMILLWPVRRAGEAEYDWSAQYLQLGSDLLVTEIPAGIGRDRACRKHIT